MTTVANRILKGGAFVFFAHVVQKGFTAIFIIIFSQLLSLQLFGELMLAVTLMNLLALVSLFGLSSALQKYCSGEDDGSLNFHFKTILSLSLIAICSVSVLLWVFSGPLTRFFEPSESFRALLGFAAAGIITQGVFRMLYETLRAREDGKGYFVADNVLSICKVTLPVAAFFAFGNPAAVVGGLALAHAVAALPVISKLKKLGLTPHISSGINHATVGIIRFALPAWMAGFTYVFAQHVDKLMLGALTNAEVVGLYAVASAIAMMLTLFHTAFASIFMPIAADLNRTGNRQDLHQGYTWVSKWSLFTCGFGVLVFAGFGDYLLRLFGPEYATPEVYGVLIILGLFYLATSASGPTGSVLQMCGSNFWESINAFAFLFLNIGANLILIPLYGVRGAAMATLFAGLGRLLLQWGQLWHRHQLQIVPLPLMGTTLVVAAFTILASGAQMYSPARASLAIGGIFALCFCQYCRMDAREREILRSLKKPGPDLFQLLKKKSL